MSDADDQTTGAGVRGGVNARDVEAELEALDEGGEEV